MLQIYVDLYNVVNAINNPQKHHKWHRTPNAKATPGFPLRKKGCIFNAHSEMVTLLICATADANVTLLICAAADANGTLLICATADANLTLLICATADANLTLLICATVDANVTLLICAAADASDLCNC